MGSVTAATFKDVAQVTQENFRTKHGRCCSMYTMFIATVHIHIGLSYFS